VQLSLIYSIIIINKYTQHENQA